MRAAIKAWDLDPDPVSLPADPADFWLLAQLLIGPADGPGAEQFQVTVCTPEWLATRCRASGEIYDPRHHLVVSLDHFDQAKLREWFEARVSKIEAPDWAGVAEQLGRFGYWEFEDLRP